jgi:hypothetical protein
MPYTIRKQKCKQSDGDAGSYVLSYTDKSGKKHSNCHTSKKKAQGQIAAIEGQWEADEIDDKENVMTEGLLRSLISLIIHSDQPRIDEAALTRIEMGKRPWRLNRVISFINDGTPFKVGTSSPYEEKKLTVQIDDKEAGKTISSSSNLTAKKDLAAFTDWIQKGRTSRYDVLPVWDGSVQSWSNVYKDPENFQFETMKQGLFGEKSLTPNSLGIAGSKMSPAALARSVESSVGDMAAADVLTTLVSDALKVKKSGSEAGKIEFSISKSAQDALAGMSPGDKRSIVKDFGEILAAVALSKALGYQLVSFPASISNPLTDFSIHSGDEDKDFSVKGLSGSGAAIKNYTDALNAVAKARAGRADEKEAAASLVAATSKGTSLHDAILIIARSGALMNEEQVQDTLLKIKTVLGLKDNFNSDDIVSALQAAGVPKSKSLIKKYYGMGLPAVPRASLDDVMSAGFTVDLVKSLFIYPVLRSVITAMNKEGSAFKRAIARSMNRMATSQAYINFDNISRPKSITVDVTGFDAVSPDNIKFVTKAGATTFKQGGIGVSIR